MSERANNNLRHACLPGADTCMHACLELTASPCILFKSVCVNLFAWDSGHYTLKEHLAVQHSRHDTDLEVHGQLLEGVLVLHALQHLHSSLHIPMMQHAPMIILQLCKIHAIPRKELQRLHYNLMKSQVLHCAAQDLPYQPMTSYPLCFLHMHAAAGMLKAGTPSGKQAKLPHGLWTHLDSRL